MVKFAASIVCAAILAGSAIAQPVSTRDIGDEDIIVTREDLNTIFGRDFVDQLEERDPFGLGLLFKGARKIFKLAKHAKHAKHASSNNNNNNNNHKRSLDFVDDLEEREPFGLGLLFKGAKKVFSLAKHAHDAHSASQNNNHKRSLDEDELLERDFEEDDLLEREYYDDLD